MSIESSLLLHYDSKVSFWGACGKKINYQRNLVPSALSHGLRAQSWRRSSLSRLSRVLDVRGGDEELAH